MSHRLFGDLAPELSLEMMLGNDDELLVFSPSVQINRNQGTHKRIAETLQVKMNKVKTKLEFGADRAAFLYTSCFDLVSGPIFFLFL